MSATSIIRPQLKLTRLRVAIVTLVAAVVVTATSVGSAEAASWSNPFVNNISVSTNAYMHVNCDTVYRNDGTKVWRVRAYLNIYNGQAGDRIVTSFALATSGGFQTSLVNTSTFNRAGNLNGYVLFDKTWIVYKSARAESVTALADFWRNGVYGGREYPQFSSSSGGYSSPGSTSCTLF